MEKNIFTTSGIMLLTTLMSTNLYAQSGSTLSQIYDIDFRQNKITDALLGDECGAIGVTAFAYEEGKKITYSLTDNADGCFEIKSGSGKVFMTRYECLNPLDNPIKNITVKAVSESGSTVEANFAIDLALHTPPDNGGGDGDPNDGNEPPEIPIESNGVLFDWNKGLNQSLEGWTWQDDVAYSNPGWILGSHSTLGDGERFRWGQGPRSFNKGDYGKLNTARVTVTDRAPSTNSGGALVVEELPNSTDHRSTWWLWYDGKPLSERGITNNSTDRMSFYLKAEGLAPMSDDGGMGSIGTNFHVGTYLCWRTGGDPSGSGQGCPYEGPGNQHYYHYLGINPGAWIHVLLDQHPTHHRGQNGKPLANNPTLESDGKHYFAQLNQMYMEIRYPQPTKTSYVIDELKFYSTSDTDEPHQNDESITSLWVGYWPNTDNWEIGFKDKSFDKLGNGKFSTFEIRWSLAPITNDNFADATPINALKYSGERYTGTTNTSRIRRPNDWKPDVWTRFQLPDEIEQTDKKIYFAIKDVSVAGGNAGTGWPWNRTDGHNSPSPYVKVIDYHLNVH
ncbi:hypothetical protein A7985_08825 [Pseudoalteromonas luteoviolacea]|uniref:Cadherin domain-containing protein n=1 Tax=Pseudoalteromonas luteoviolacea TaxID=43657 RepID=A0A1C0TRL5_9GAMM|nr:hypothetical protein [Pseudoalteromonas luteoviolacea]OCQ21902.1 hypothetical protein A7985_08825 [Pseudoalteromonas luteoviolacea]